MYEHFIEVVSQPHRNLVIFFKICTKKIMISAVKLASQTSLLSLKVKMSLNIAILNGDTFEHNSVTKWHFSQILKIHEYQKNSHIVTFEMKMSLCDTFISKVSPFEITIISDILTFGDKSDVCDAFFSPLVLYKKSHKVTFSNQILKIHNLSQKWHYPRLISKVTFYSPILKIHEYQKLKFKIKRL